MNKELIFIRLLLYKKEYNLYKEYINVNDYRRISIELSYVLQTLIDLHTSVEGDISVDELVGYFLVKYPDAKLERYEQIFEQLRAVDISENVAEVILADVIRNKAAIRLAEELFKVTQGAGSQEEIKRLYGELEAPVVPEHKYTPVSLGLQELMHKVRGPNGIRWRLQFLNKSLGSLRDGDFGFLMARPESGKTALLASEGSFALPQIQRPLVWFNNEEQDEKVILRLYQAHFGRTAQQIFDNWETAEERFMRHFRDKFLFFGIDRCNKKDIEAIIREYNPALVYYDQASKIKGFKSDRNDLLLGDIFIWLREMAKIYRHAGLSAHQADGTAEGVKWLTMDHAANAKTAIQAEADFILGLGKVHDPAFEFVRYLNVSKNKLLGDEDSLANLRHGRQEVLLKPEIMRYEDMVQYV